MGKGDDPRVIEGRRLWELRRAALAGDDDEADAAEVERRTEEIRREKQKRRRPVDVREVRDPRTRRD